MSDREKMIEVIENGPAIEEPGDIADRLIEAGFGMNPINVVEEIPNYLELAKGLQELSELLLDQHGIKRTKKAQEFWESVRGEELGIYSAFLSEAITPIINARVALYKKEIKIL